MLIRFLVQLMLLIVIINLLLLGNFRSKEVGISKIKTTHQFNRRLRIHFSRSHQLWIWIHQQWEHLVCKVLIQKLQARLSTMQPWQKRNNKSKTSNRCFKSNSWRYLTQGTSTVRRLKAHSKVRGRKYYCNSHNKSHNIRNRSLYSTKAT